MSKKPWRAGKDLASVVENMEIGTGQRGDGKDAFVTQRQLAELKLAKMSGGSGGIRLVPGLGQGSLTMKKWLAKGRTTKRWRCWRCYAT